MHLFCKRCGRKLSSKLSQERGYGSYCYSKVGSDEKINKKVEIKQNNNEERIEIEGQIDILEELKQRKIS